MRITASLGLGEVGSNRPRVAVARPSCRKKSCGRIWLRGWVVTPPAENVLPQRRGSGPHPGRAAQMDHKPLVHKRLCLVSAVLAGFLCSPTHLGRGGPRGEGPRESPTDSVVRQSRHVGHRYPECSRIRSPRIVCRGLLAPFATSTSTAAGSPNPALFLSPWILKLSRASLLRPPRPEP